MSAQKRHAGKTASLMLTLGVCCFVLLNCDPQREDSTPYSSGFDNSSLVTQTQAEGYPDIRYPINQLVVYTEETVTRDEFFALIAGRTDVTVVGQVPSIGFYQLETRTSTRAELDALKSQLLALDGIQGAVYNMLMSELADVGSCPVEPDVGLDDVSEYDKLPYYQTNYYTALEIMEGLRDYLTLSTVTIGIVEMGYDQNSEFNDITITNVSEILDNGTRLALESDRALKSHGTSVAGIICGDNDGSGINGMASTLIGSKLRVVMANPRYTTPTWMGYCVAMAMTVIEGGADIVNSSFGLGPFDNATSAEARETIAAFSEVMRRYPDVLFVNAAPNTQVELTGNNHAPAGISLSNTLTVSRWQHEHPERIVASSGYGSRVDISGPGDQVKTVVPGGTITPRGGTSFATPFVTSAAALLKSIGGSTFSPAEIKTMLLDPSFSAERTEPGGGIQLNFAYPLVDLLWQEYQGQDWAEEYLADVGGEQHLIPEIVASRLCEATWLTVDSFSTYELNVLDECSSGTSLFLSPDGLQWSVHVSHLSNDAGDLAELSMNSGADPFAIDTHYTFPDHTLLISIADTDLINDQCEWEDPDDGDYSYRGTASNGTYSFTNCRIAERNPDGKAKYLRLDVSFSGIIDGYHTTYYPSNETVGLVTDELQTTFSGLIKDVLVATLDPFGTFSQAVEEACIGESL